jgi:hypothetical protein
MSVRVKKSEPRARAPASDALELVRGQLTRQLAAQGLKKHDPIPWSMQFHGLLGEARKALPSAKNLEQQAPTATELIEQAVKLVERSVGGAGTLSPAAIRDISEGNAESGRLLADAYETLTDRRVSLRQVSRENIIQQAHQTWAARVKVLARDGAVNLVTSGLNGALRGILEDARKALSSQATRVTPAELIDRATAILESKLDAVPHRNRDFALSDFDALRATDPELVALVAASLDADAAHLAADAALRRELTEQLATRGIELKSRVSQSDGAALQGVLRQAHQVLFAPGVSRPDATAKELLEQAVVLASSAGQTATAQRANEARLGFSITATSVLPAERARAVAAELSHAIAGNDDWLARVRGEDGWESVVAKVQAANDLLRGLLHQVEPSLDAKPGGVKRLLFDSQLDSAILATSRLEKLLSPGADSTRRSIEEALETLRSARSEMNDPEEVKAYLMNKAVERARVYKFMGEPFGETEHAQLDLPEGVTLDEVNDAYVAWRATVPVMPPNPLDTLDDIREELRRNLVITASVLSPHDASPLVEAFHALGGEQGQYIIKTDPDGSFAEPVDQLSSYPTRLETILAALERVTLPDDQRQEVERPLRAALRKLQATRSPGKVDIGRLEQDAVGVQVGSTSDPEVAARVAALGAPLGVVTPAKVDSYRQQLLAEGDRLVALPEGTAGRLEQMQQAFAEMERLNRMGIDVIERTGAADVWAAIAHRIDEVIRRRDTGERIGDGSGAVSPEEVEAFITEMRRRIASPAEGDDVEQLRGLVESAGQLRTRLEGQSLVRPPFGR